MLRLTGRRPWRCFCSAPLHEDDGLVVCTSGHVFALASALPDAALLDPRGGVFD